MPKINVSFKNTTKDMRLYMIAISQEEKSEFIKDCIKYWLEHHKKDSKKSGE